MVGLVGPYFGGRDLMTIPDFATETSFEIAFEVSARKSLRQDNVSPHYISPLVQPS